ncbi:transcriptional regulator [Breoghania sp. L-A4]|uniref:transcriptional regulator n=1 Tax=Breoghania sp. L-A4 TaxID=2304600 RepID=UPI0020BF506B|nr:transcriptional regulator [Breoghania sp. L-A4]
MRTTLSSLALLAGLLASAGLAHSARAAELVMLEQQGCEWCAMWHEQIGPIYPKTEEGRRAPLRQVDIHAPMPDDLSEIRSDHFTPTFVLVEDGVEIGRIRGYPGEDFFWGCWAGFWRIWTRPRRSEAPWRCRMRPHDS